jgi:hypothetical protein
VGGLYPLLIDEIKQVCSIARSLINIGHKRLGYASRKVIAQVLRRNNILSFQESVSQSLCDACQQAKSHQLPYSSSLSSSKFPLKLVYSNVWGPTPESVGRKNTTSPLLMIVANLYGFIYLNSNLKCFRKKSRVPDPCPMTIQSSDSCGANRLGR